MHASPTAIAQYRVAAVPIFAPTSGDIIIYDQHGLAFLLASDSVNPTPLNQTDIDALGMFYESTVDPSWHSEAELRQMFSTDAVPATNL